MRLPQLEFTQPIFCYDGAFDSATLEVIKNREEAFQAIREEYPEAHVTYFPVEQTWVVHVWGKELSSHHQSKGAALTEVLLKIMETKK